MAEIDPMTAPGPVRVAGVGDRVRPANHGDLGYLYTLYRFYDVEGRLLYLGRSERVRQRIVDLEIGHPRGLPLGHDDGPKPWWREAARIELEHLPPGTTEAEARAEERRQIELGRPVYNREHNESSFERDRFERAMDLAHFEVDVATSEHERHDGVIRSVDRISIESEAAAERLRPSGAARLRYGLRRPAIPERAPAHRATPGPGGQAERSRDRREFPSPTARPSRRFEGPGSVGGVVVVSLILAALTIAAVVISLRAVF